MFYFRVAPGRRSQRGQVMPIIAMVLLILVAFAGLALDGVHLYLVRRQAQNASDAAALAGGKWLIATGGILTAPPSSSTSAPVSAAHDIASANGFSTVLNSACDSSTGLQFSTTWFDNGSSCTSSDFNIRVTVHVPPQGPTPPDCVNIPYNCFQVGVTERVPNFLVGVIGIPTTDVSASAVVLAQPAAPQIGTPPPTALYLYEPHGSACAGDAQCFTASQPPLRQQLSCKNCPTFWVAPGAGTTIAGVDGKKLSPPSDRPALQSNGDMVIQTDTTICDPYGGATCQAGRATGAEGFGIAPSATLYCSGFSAGSANGLTGCTNTGQSNLAHVASNEVPFTSETWSPTVNAAGLPACGTLVLNGDTVAHGLSGSDAKCVPPSSEPYSIMPGIYQYIVINHGTYEFQPGLYDITGIAPQNAISHGNENNADFDLCEGVPGNNCEANAGVWIGHGNNPYTAGSSSKTSCLGLGSNGGGGDATIITGTGVTFRFRSTSAGFVSTHEVQQISLTAPGLAAQLSYTAGVPLLFDMENSGTIHLDSQPPSGGKSSRFTGIVYQTINATAGGVEINPGMAGGSGALAGQVLAYSFNTFGQNGMAVDFSQGYGTASAPVIGTSGHNETEMLTSWSFTDLGNGKGQFQVKYTDEWALDGYDSYIKINGGDPIFFSQGIWQTPNPQNPPPAINNPGDSNPAYPISSQDVAGVYAKTTTGGLPDWTYTFSDGSTFETAGNWTWGHEQDIPGAVSTTNHATLTYTFQAPPGQTIDILIFMTDGDHCGDYVSASATFNNVSTPGAGQQSSGSVLLID
jgi:putative Flp pilus-assembly TadE/G-like protein